MSMELFIQENGSMISVEAALEAELDFQFQHREEVRRLTQKQKFGNNYKLEKKLIEISARKIKALHNMKEELISFAA